MGFLADYIGKPALNIVIGHFLEKGVKLAKERMAELPSISKIKIPTIPQPKAVKYPPHVSHVTTSAPLKRQRAADEVIEAEYRLTP